MSRKKRCAACGHTEADHNDGLMGARVNDDWLCHQDDHTCYAAIGDNGETLRGWATLADTTEAGQ